MKCPRCLEELLWQSDFPCDEWNFCSCSKGIVTLLICTNCNTQVVATTDCEEIML